MYTDSALISLGFIAPTPGTPVDVFQNFPLDRSAQLFVNLLVFQAGVANTGPVYIGTPHLNVGTNVGVLYVLSAAADAFAVGVSSALNIFQVSSFYIDVANPGDGAYVSICIR